MILGVLNNRSVDSVSSDELEAVVSQLQYNIELIQAELEKRRKKGKKKS